MKLFVGIFSGVALLFIVIGAWQVFDQQRIITSAQPMRARVQSSSVDVRTSYTSKGRRNTTYTPKVQYFYTHNGRRYDSERVFPMFSSARRKYADEIVARFRTGQEVNGWHVDGPKQRSFLIRQWDFSPYLFVLFPMIHFTVGMGVWAAAGRLSRRENPPIPTTGGWYELPPRASVAQKRRPWAIAALAWMGVGGGAIAHYFTVADRPYETSGLVIAPIYLAIGLVPLIMYLRYWKLSRQAGDARLLVNVSTFAPGQAFDVRIEQLYNQHLLIDAYRIGLICDQTVITRSGGKSTQSTNKLHETWKDALKNEQTMPSLPIVAKATFMIPADKPPSSPPKEKQFPRFDWRISVDVKIPNAPDYRADFPIVVKLPVNA